MSSMDCPPASGSAAIVAHLEAEQPAPPLFPADEAAADIEDELEDAADGGGDRPVLEDGPCIRGDQADGGPGGDDIGDAEAELMVHWC